MIRIRSSQLKATLLAVGASLAIGPQTLGGTVKVTVKSLKEATHIELSGLNEWRYEVTRKKINDHSIVRVQLTGVGPLEFQSLEKIHDPRVTSVSVKEGENNGAVLEFTLAENKMGFFDYQTEAPSSLILDIYKEDLNDDHKQKISKMRKPTKEEMLAKFISKKDKKESLSSKKARGNSDRSIASVDHPEIGSQPLLSERSDLSKLQMKYGIFDGGDQNLSRFKIDTSEINEASQIRAERNMYLHFPMLTTPRMTLKDILAETPNYDVHPVDSEENQQVRLIVRLLNEGKYAVALRTLKFFYEKFHETAYQKTLDFVAAEIYLKLWQRDHNRVDFEAAMTRFKEILNKYPTDESRFRILMLVGLNYLDIGNNMGALSTFQVGVKNYPESPYFWQMRIKIAETLNNLNKDKASLKELDEIESSPVSKEFAIEARYRRGDVFFHAKDFTSAVKEYHAALTRYPDKWAQGPNIYFNSAEADFWLKNYKVSLEEFREFLQRFPMHSYGGYAMTRIGEILNILGAKERKSEGAYLESYFRYHDSPGAFVAKIHINTNRYASMKEKELVVARKEIGSELSKIDLPEVETFVTLREADGLTARRDFGASNGMLTKYYQTNILSPYLSLFKFRIVQNITSEMDCLNQKKDYMKALETFIQNSDSWLSKNERIDTSYFAGQAYEALNVPLEATNYYEKSLKAKEALGPDQMKRAEVFEKLPSSDQINLRLANVSLKNDDVKKASLYLNNIKDPEKLADKDRIERALILSVVAEKEEKPELAILALKDLSEHWNGKETFLVDPWMRMARVNSSLKKYGEALLWTEKVVETAKKNSATVNHEVAREALDLSAELYVKLNKPALAIGAYKLYLEKFGDQTQVATVKYKLGKLYFDQQNFREATQVWSSLKDEAGGELWDKMAKEQLAQAQWDKKYTRYFERKPAGGDK